MNNVVCYCVFVLLRFESDDVGEYIGFVAIRVKNSIAIKIKMKIMMKCVVYDFFIFEFHLRHKALHCNLMLR